MKGHLFTIVALLLALACYARGFAGAGMLLFFVAAALEVVLWLRAVQSPRRVPQSLLARIGARR
jgi:hypothetical protein